MDKNIKDYQYPERCHLARKYSQYERQHKLIVEKDSVILSTALWRSIGRPSHIEFTEEQGKTMLLPAEKLHMGKTYRVKQASTLYGKFFHRNATSLAEGVYPCELMAEGALVRQ